MNDVFEVCDFVLQYEHSKDRLITHLRLQKLLYFIQGRFLIFHNQLCFSEKMEAWRYGPVIPTAYSYYKQYGTMLIPPSQRSSLDKAKSKLTHWDTIARLLDEAEYVTSDSLVAITKSQSPWQNNYYCDLPGEIDESSLRKFFCEED